MASYKVFGTLLWKGELTPYIKGEERQLVVHEVNRTREAERRLRKMPKIPVNKDDMPTGALPLDEGLVYHGYIEKCEYGGKNKSDNNFAKLKLKVLEPEEYKDRIVFCNHMPIVSGHEDPFYMFSNFCLAFKVDPNGFDGGGFDPDDSQLIGLEGDFSIENDKDGKFPPRVKEFLSASAAAPRF